MLADVVLMSIAGGDIGGVYFGVPFSTTIFQEKLRRMEFNMLAVVYKSEGGKESNQI